jgi:hypothetical protein
MNKLLATVAIVAGLLSVGSSAQAFGINYSYFANKPYMGCLKYIGSISKNEQQREKGVRICNKQYGYRYN